MTPAYRSVDHVMLRVKSAEPLFSLFSETLGLPVAWPLQSTEFATYGWVHIGNTDLEVWAATHNDDLPAQARLPLIHGFALEPRSHLAHSIQCATEAGIRCKSPRAFQTLSVAGEPITNFTNSVLLDLSAPSCCVFFCEWDQGASIYPWEEAATPGQRRVRHAQTLHDRQGGPLGVNGLDAIRMRSPEAMTLQRHWRAFSSSQSDRPIALTPDIRLEVETGEHLWIESLALGVRSLPAARAFLASRQMLEKDGGDFLSVACEGLQIHLVETASS